MQTLALLVITLDDGEFHGGAKLQGASIVASIPNDAAAGPGDLYVPRLFGPTITSCDGFAYCIGVPPAFDALTATIAP